MNNLRIKTGGKVLLEICNDQESIKCTSIELSSCGKTISEEAFRNFMCNNIRKDKKVLLNSNGVFALADDTRYFIKLHPEQCTHAFFDENTLDKVQIKTNEGVSIENYWPVEEVTEKHESQINQVAFE